MRLAAIALTIGACGAAVLAQQRTVTDAEVQRVHRSAILIDTHDDVTSYTVDGLDIGPRNNKTQTDLVKLKEGGVAATFFAVYVAADYVKQNNSAKRALEMIDTVRHDIFERYADRVRLVTTADGIVRAHKDGKFAALMGIEGGHAIEDSLRLLRQFYQLGIRYMTLTHVNTNDWADSSGDLDDPSVTHHNGLTDFGRQVVAEMNRLGMMVDVSHVSDKTFWDALEASKAPIFASHSSCRAVSDIPRNMTDEMIVAMAKKGGVIQINFGCAFLSPAAREASPYSNPKLLRRMNEIMQSQGVKDEAEAIRQALKDLGLQNARASIDDVVTQINHVVKIAGIGAVGIGSDFDGVGCVPDGLEDVSKFPALTRKLLEASYSAEDIRKFYGGNFLRTMREVERVSRSLRAKEGTHGS